MPVTKQDLKRYYPDAESIERIDSMQLFKACYPDKVYLISYRTVIGVKRAGVWYITTQKYSPSTSRQTTRFLSRLYKQGYEHDKTIKRVSDLSEYL